MTLNDRMYPSYLDGTDGLVESPPVPLKTTPGAIE